MSNYIADMNKLISMFYSFLAYVNYLDGDCLHSFRDKNTYLGREEDYKSEASEQAKNVLGYGEWKESWIGSGKILKRALLAIDCAGNLVNYYQKRQFKNMISPEHIKYSPEAERAIYDVYKSHTVNEEKDAFNQAQKVFGSHYDTIGFLFFAKDADRFLPVASRNFDSSFVSVGIDYHLEGQCSWDNYTGFIGIIKNVQDIMRDILPDTEIRLIDAHTFLWVINENSFRNWAPETDVVKEIETFTENYLSSVISGCNARKSRVTKYLSRSAEVAMATKTRAKGVCQLCGMPAPFMDSKGNPYLEAHHIVWLSKGGKDSTENTVALCPNCHTKMHIVDDAADVELLRSKVK